MVCEVSQQSKVYGEQVSFELANKGYDAYYHDVTARLYWSCQS